MKLTFISDTHLKEPVLPGGDILFHCGDLTINGFRSEVIRSLNYLHEQSDKYKDIVIIPGNHDFWAERHPEDFKEACFSAGIIGLINDGIEIEGLKIWGSPATKIHHNWAFNFNSQELKKIWERMPDRLDILLSHGPPFEILDLANHPKRGTSHEGDIDLLERVNEVNPKIHAFGHIHESAGTKQIGQTLFINCATKVINLEIGI